MSTTVIRNSQQCPKNNLSKGICTKLRSRSETQDEKYWNNCINDNDDVWNNIQTLNQYCRNDFNNQRSYFLNYREKRDCGNKQSKGLCKTSTSSIIEGQCPPDSRNINGTCYKNCPSGFQEDADGIGCKKNEINPTCQPGQFKYWGDGQCYFDCPSGSSFDGKQCSYLRDGLVQYCQDQSYSVPDPSTGIKAYLRSRRESNPAKGFCYSTGDTISCNKEMTPNPDPSLIFTFYQYGPNTYAFSSNNGFCSQEDDKKIRCNRKGVSSWEKFNIEQGSNKIYIKGRSGQYCSNDGVIICDRNSKDTWEEFEALM